MFHKAVLVLVFAFAVGLVGCRSCWGPYDHCQPTFVPEAGDVCMGDLYRNGSVLGGMEQYSKEGCGGCGACSSCAGNYASNQEYSGAYDESIVPTSYTEPTADSSDQTSMTQPLPENFSRTALPELPGAESGFPEQFALSKGE